MLFGFVHFLQHLYALVRSDFADSIQNPMKQFVGVQTGDESQIDVGRNRHQIGGRQRLASDSRQ